MDVRKPVKHLLRMCGHAIVSTVHERLDNVDRQLAHIVDQNVHLAQNQTALLQSGVHLVQSLPQIQSELQQVELRLAGQMERIRRESNHAFAKIASANAQELAEHLDGFGSRLDNAVSSSLGLGEAIETLRQRVVDAVNNLAAANGETASAGARTVAEHMESIGHRLDTAVTGSQGLGVAIESVRQRLVDAVNSLSTANAEAQEAGLAILRPTLAGVLNLEREYSATRDSIALLEPVARETRNFLANEAVRQVVVETSEYAPVNPELGLMSFLYSHLPGRNAIDIGAHIGEVSSYLLKTGYEVYAFEPYPPNFIHLSERLKGHQAFHPFNLALGAVDGELPLHLVTDSTSDHIFDDPTVFHSLAPHGMPEGLSFDGTTNVAVKRLSDLHRNGVIPADISLVKIDTEGYDLEVIRGMDGHRYPVVCVEFWDSQIPFASNGLLYTLESIVHEMGQRYYFWYIVLYRVWGLNQTAFFCNHDRSVPSSWGNVFFFRDNDTFQQAQQWCGAVLPRTYFKSVPATQATTP